MVNMILKINRKFHKQSDDKNKKLQKPATGITKLSNLNYHGDANRGHLLDIFYPENSEGLLPTIIEIHGGGWVYGDKELNEYHAMYLASHGFAVFNINYQLSPEVRLDGQIQDIFKALSWIEKHGKEHHADTTKLFFTGDSAGGHLSLLAALTQTSPELQKIYQVKPVGLKVSAVAVTCPVALLHNMLNGTDKTIALLRFWMFGKDLLNNPISKYASIDDVLALGVFPETMIVTTIGDQQLHKYSVALDKLLTDKKIDHLYKNYESEGNPIHHVFNVLHINYEESRRANDDIVSFFKKHMT
ncbi:MAG: alpha/beta hydrolase [Firmicutes bacterium]|nr:alpha/beta hydrolase [Bacillota bacterium]